MSGSEQTGIHEREIKDGLDALELFRSTLQGARL